MQWRLWPPSGTPLEACPVLEAAATDHPVTGPDPARLQQERKNPHQLLALLRTFLPLPITCCCLCLLSLKVWWGCQVVGKEHAVGLPGAAEIS